MEYFDEELLEVKRSLERKKYNTFETGMFAGEELIEFTRILIPDTKIFVWLPKSFVPMPREVKSIKYPSVNAPEFIISSLDTLVNIGFTLLPVILENDEIKSLRQQFQTAIININPTIKIQNQKDEKTKQGNDMSWFDFSGYCVDGHSYNRVYLIRMQKQIFHGIFNCMLKDRNNWSEIVSRIFETIEEV